MKLNLNNYNKIIFDLDGVITSELAYWQAAALGAYDLLFDSEHYGIGGIDREYCRRQYQHIYTTIMCGGRTVKAVKRLGINTNWDLLYTVFCISKYLNPELESLDAAHFQSVCMFIENIEQKAPDVYFTLGSLASHAMPNYDEKHFMRGNDGLWQELLGVFDLWYDGCAEFEGIKVNDELLFDDDEVKSTLEYLKSQNIVLGIGSGRPRDEIINPLKMHGIIDCFDLGLFASFDEVCEAEQALKPELPLAKPDPFVFLKAALGKEYSDADLHNGNFDKSKLKGTLIVGDAPSDLMSAKSGGFDFLGVLTGVEGDGMLSYFTQNHAEYILNDIRELVPNFTNSESDSDSDSK